jgi:hypothetical protein
MKTLLFALFMCLSATCFSQSQDTTITTMIVKKCNESDKGFAVSAKMHQYIETFEAINMAVEVIYRGDAIIDDKEYECVVIYRIIFKLKKQK